jgi:hypothetical protein
VVLIVRSLVAVFAFGVTVAGLNVHPAPAGRPEHEKPIGLLNGPCGVTVSVKEADFPAATAAVVGVEDNAKSLALTV